jgi:putative endonuclease
MALFERLRARATGVDGESQALTYLRSQGLRLLTRNYRCKGGEIDLIMATPRGETVFVEVRVRNHAHYGGAAASVGGHKQRRLIRAAHHYLAQLPAMPPCRFDVIAIDAGKITWLTDAFGVA